MNPKDKELTFKEKKTVVKLFEQLVKLVLEEEEEEVKANV